MKKTYSDTDYRNGVTYYDTFIFNSDGTDVRKSNWTDLGKFTKVFTWHIEIPVFGDPYVVVNYDGSEDEDYTFTIVVDSNDKVTAIKGKNTYKGQTLD